MVVFLLCGLWHGPSWSFVVWGLFHGLFLVVERRGIGAWLETRGGPLAHAYTLLVWTVGMVMFRATGLEHAGMILRSMFGSNALTNPAYPLALYVDPGLCCVLALACVGSTPVVPACRAWLAGHERRFAQGASAIAWSFLQMTGRLSLLGVLLWVSAVMLSASTYNPFIYFQF